ncbi:MAG: phage minor head protein [Eikenella sp.]|nr:phage minor head protein [Eikenella sp.]
MGNKADLGYAFTLTPERAVRYFETLGYTVPADWPQRAQEAAAKAQTVAGLYRQDLVGELHQAMADAARQGKPFAAWRDDVAARFGAKGLQLDQAGDLVDTASGEVAGTGLTRARLETVYRTNMQSAFMAGRWQELQDNKAHMPYLQYTAVMDSRTRPRHRALHGLVYHIDDAFWDAFYPPNGYNCRCTVTAYSQRDLDRRGLAANDSRGQIEDTHIIINKRGDSVPAKALRLPDGSRFTADRGFDGNVGRRHLAQLGQLQLQRAVDLPPRVASMAVGETLKRPETMRSLVAQMTQMVAKAQADGYASGQFMHVGVLPLPVLDALAARQLMPQTAVVSINDERLWHAWRDKKQQPLPIDFWERLPEHLAAPDEIRLAKSNNPGQQDGLLFIYDLPGQNGKLVVTLDYELKTRHPVSNKKERVTTNMVNTGSIVVGRQIYNLHQYDLIWKK